MAKHVAECKLCAQGLSLDPSHLDAATIVESAPQIGQPLGEASDPQRRPEDVTATKSAAGDNGASVCDVDLTFLIPSDNQQALGRIGNYDVLAVVGRGGMGIVLKAFDASLQRVVAIKVLAPELACSSKARRRFVREARAAAAINHPNVIVIHAVDEQKGMPYLVMEYVAGCTLRERIQRLPHLEAIDAMRIGAQIAAGLAAAHEQGVIHRDIKPSNVMLEASMGRVKIADFGLARAAMDLSDITSLGQAVGTPAYVSPEQVVGKEIDARSDLFSLGCLLYALFTGRSPFRGRTTLEVIRQVADHQPPNLAEVDRRVPPSLADIVQRLLEKDPQNRFQSARDVTAMLNNEIALLNQMPSDKLPYLATKRQPAGWRFKTLGMAALVAAVSGLLVWRPWHVQSAKDNSFAGLIDSPAVSTAILRVSRDGRADYRTIGKALESAAPGSTIEVLDEGPYEEAIVFDQPRRWRGVSLIAKRNALIQAPPGKSRGVITIAGTPDVTVRGFRFRPASEQHAIHIIGNVEGLSIEHAESHKEATSAWAHVLISDMARGSEKRPIAIHDSVFAGGSLGIVLLGAKGAPVKAIRIEQNRFTGAGMHVQVLQSVEHVQVVGNILEGGCGVYLSLEVPDGSHRVLVANNTFVGTVPWLGLGGSNPRQQMIVVANNLILGADEISTPNLLTFLDIWSFRHNWCEVSEGSSVTPPTSAVERQTSIDLASRDRSSPDFLRPADDSALARSGAGGDLPHYIGARPPAHHD